MLPKISIITPSYNQGHFIEQTIQSVLEQGYPNLEYIIIDGGSTDDTVDIIKKYEAQVTYWVSEKDKGQSDAINKGFRLATGDVINWLNSDDYYEAGILHHVAKIFGAEYVKAYVGRSRVFGNGVDVFTKGTDVYPGNLYKTIGWARIDQPETFFRKSAIDTIGYLNESLHYIMDKDLWIRFLCRYGVNHIVKDNELVAHFRLHQDSKTVALRNNFSTESKDLYYAYAVNEQLENYISKLNSIFKLKTLQLDKFPIGITSIEWSYILNYFILREGLEAYAMNDFKQANEILGSINASLLQEDDLKTFNNVLLRLKFLPMGIKKIWNKIIK